MLPSWLADAHAALGFSNAAVVGACSGRRLWLR
jgi:hypothetical protein